MAQPKEAAPYVSGYCNRTLPRTAAYDPHQRCKGCDCSCHTEEPEMDAQTFDDAFAEGVPVVLEGEPSVSIWVDTWYDIFISWANEETDTLDFGGVEVPERVQLLLSLVSL